MKWSREKVSEMKWIRNEMQKSLLIEKYSFSFIFLILLCFVLLLFFFALKNSKNSIDQQTRKFKISSEPLFSTRQSCVFLFQFSTTVTPFWLKWVPFLFLKTFTQLSYREIFTKNFCGMSKFSKVLKVLSPVKSLQMFTQFNQGQYGRNQVQRNAEWKSILIPS